MIIGVPFFSYHNMNLSVPPLFLDYYTDYPILNFTTQFDIFISWIKRCSRTRYDNSYVWELS